MSAQDTPSAVPTVPATSIEIVGEDASRIVDRRGQMAGTTTRGVLYVHSAPRATPARRLLRAPGARRAVPAHRMGGRGRAGPPPVHGLDPPARGARHVPCRAVLAGGAGDGCTGDV